MTKEFGFVGDDDVYGDGDDDFEDYSDDTDDDGGDENDDYNTGGDDSDGGDGVVGCKEWSEEDGRTRLAICRPSSGNQLDRMRIFILIMVMMMMGLDIINMTK